MAKKDNGQFVYSHYDNGNDFLKLAKPPAAIVTRNGGSHAKITVISGEYTGQSMIVPEHDLGIGLSHKIWAWFKMVGLIVLMIAIFAFAMSAAGL